MFPSNYPLVTRKRAPASNKPEISGSGRAQACVLAGRSGSRIERVLSAEKLFDKCSNKKRSRSSLDLVVRSAAVLSFPPYCLRTRTIYSPSF
jgi:hypothetical protein